ncbi:hypothetical protein AH156_19670 [Salmonella enterica subsp. enterica serovar Enteritidis]|nr:hypothetical protein [Salmonella enterica subsp. enterica serovar Enteritidis]
MSVFFNGQLLVTPQTASAVNDDAMLNQNLSVGNVLAVVGESTGGEPMKVLEFSNPNEARRVLESGKLCDAVIAAFAPSSQTGSPQTVSAVRINTVDKASLDVMCDTTIMSGTNGVFGTFKAKNWGIKGTQIRVQLEVGKSPNLRNISVSGGMGTNVWTKAQDDIGGIRLLVTNHSFDCTMQFEYVPGGNRLGMLNLNIGATDEKHLTFDLAAYPTLGDLTDYLETFQDNGGVQIFTFQYSDPLDRDLPSNIIDPGIITATIPNQTPVAVGLTWRAYAIQEWCEKNVSEYLEFVPNVATSQVWHEGVKPMKVSYLIAPSTSPVTAKEWNDGLALLERRDVQWVHVATGNPAIHALVMSHVQVCSNTFRRERRTICGTELNTSDDDAIKAAKALNNPRVSLVHIGHYAYDLNGKLVLRPAYYTAGLVAAGFAGVNPGTPLTNKTLAVQGLERDLINPSETDKLIKGGVMPIENTETGYKVTQSISTWLGDSKYNKREQSCGVAVDFAIRNVRQALDILRGEKQSPILLARAVSIAKGSLTELARPEPQGPAVLVGDENSPAWRNVSATVEGDVLRVQFEASPVIPNNYVLVTMYAVPYSGSATA